MMVSPQFYKGKLDYSPHPHPFWLLRIEVISGMYSENWLDKMEKDGIVLP